MKVTIDIDCTPQEARAFLGLPDVAPMQEAMMKEIQDKMKQNIDAMDITKMMDMWMPAAGQTAQAFQNMFSGFMNQGKTD